MTTKTDVAQLYTAFFNRAPDSAGLGYWMNELDAGGISLEAMSKNWVDEQPEALAKYPSGMSDTDFIGAIYHNVLGRAADADGAQYWQDQMNSGAMSRDVFLAAIINGAHGNTSSQGLLDAQLLDNKAAVGVAFAAAGINNTALAAKVLTTVTASADSLSSTLSLIKLIPADSNLTPALVSKFSDTLDKVAALIAGHPAEQADLATYLSTVSSEVTSSTNLDTLLTKIGTVATSALTDSTALDNPATLAHDDVAASNPPVDGGGTGPSDPVDPSAGVLTATSAKGVLKIDGTGTADVRVDLTGHKVTSGTDTVKISGDATFTDVDATGYGGSVTAVGTVKEIAGNNPTFTKVASLEVVDTASAILAYAKTNTLTVDKVSVLDNAAGHLTVDGYTELATLTGNHDWSYDIHDSVDAITAAEGNDALLNTSTVVVTDTLANLQTDNGVAAIAAHPDYTVRDTYDHIANPAGGDADVLTAAAHTVVHDNVAGVQAAIADSSLAAGWSYEVEDTAENLLTINDEDPSFLAGSTSVTVPGNDAGDLTIGQREDLGKVTDDDSWAYTISDTGENIVAASVSHVDYLQRAGDITVVDSLTLAQADKISALPKLNTDNLHYSITDTVSNTAGHADIGNVFLTASASDAADNLDGNITTGEITMSFAGLTSAATFSFGDAGFTSAGPVDNFTNFANTTDRIDLSAYNLTGEDVLSAAAAGNHTITDGHFAIINGVELVGGVYTASDAPTAGSLVIWDADTTAGVVKQVGVWVSDPAVDASGIIAGGAPA